MKLRDTLLGLLVLAVLGGGVYWARSRPLSSGATEGAHPGALPDGRAPASTEAGGASGSSMAHRVATAASDEMLPDVTRADATATAGDVRITLSVTPHPPVAFQANRFRVRVESAGGPAVLQDGRIWFEMVMPMGDHRYTLLTGADGWQEAEVVLPMCKSGNPRWYANVEGSVAGQPRRARFRLDLGKPSGAPAS